MTGNPGPARPPSLLSLRTRWAGLTDLAEKPALSVRLLASYTIDPLVPYLGTCLHDSGLPASLTVGPFNQIMQQCLDEDGETARIRPDVLLVALRFEEPGTPTTGENLLQAADAALTAAQRWKSCLVPFLPAIPEERAYGVGDAGRQDGAVARAAAIREHLRSLLADRPNVCLIDTEDAIRTIGSRQAHRPALYRHARVPYSEEVFHLLARQTATLLRIRYRGGRRVVALDADSLVRDDSHGPALGELAGPLRQLRQTGARLAVRGSGDADTLWPRLDARLPALTRHPEVKWAVDDRPLVSQLDSLAAEFGAETGQLVLVTADSSLAEVVTDAGASASVVVLPSDAPEQWCDSMLAAGLLDDLPGPRLTEPGQARGAHPAAEPGLAPAPPAPLTLAEFVAGLDVRITFRDLKTGLDKRAAELINRAHDFTLGRPLADAAGTDDSVFAADVADRMGDYGTGAVVVMDAVAPTCHVQVFSVSCPAMGRGVEEAVLREIVTRADGAGCSAVHLEYEDTGRNQAAIEFLRQAACMPWPTPSGQQIQVCAPRAGSTP